MNKTMESYILRKSWLVCVFGTVLLFALLCMDLSVYAKGPTYQPMEDVYYTKENAVVYAEPDYTSTVLTTLGANLPVRVVGAYSNGWYRIHIGVICYVKMDSLTTAGAIGLPIGADSQIADAQRTATELGYQFVYLKLNDEKVIEKEIFNSYIDQKVILYVKVDDELGVSFKMLYNDKVKKDIDLNYTKSAVVNADGAREVTFTLGDPTELFGQIAIFQFKEGYDKKVAIAPVNPDNLEGSDFIDMNVYWTEFSEFAYAPVTQVASIQITEQETSKSLSDSRRLVMADLRKGIKYQADDESTYRKSIPSRLRKDTEYVDYNY